MGYVVRLRRKLNLSTLQNYTFLQNPHLRHFLTEWLLAEQHFVVDDANWPDIHLGAYSWSLVHKKALRRQIPVCADTLRRQLHLSCLVIQDFTETEISNFDLATMEKYVLWLQVIMDDLFRKRMQVLYGIHDLPNQQFGLFFLYGFVFLQVIA